MSPAGSQPISLALCICTAGRPGALAALMERLAGVAWPEGASPFLVIVDNRPSAASREGTIAAAARLALPVLTLAEPTPGISHARNRAVAAALHRGADLVAFIDDDDQPAPDWLAQLVMAQRRTGADLVFGSQAPAPGTPIPAVFRDLSYFARKPEARLNAHGIPSGASSCNVLLTRRLLTGLGEAPFRPELGLVGGEDTDLFVRAVRAGHGFAVAEASLVWRAWEPDRLTWAGLTRRAFRYGVARLHLRLAHGRPSRRGREAVQATVRLARKAGGLLLALGRGPRLAAAYFRLVEELGATFALFGGRYAYYGRNLPGAALTAPAPPPPSSAPGPA